MASTTTKWPAISYIHEGTGWSRQVRASLEHLADSEFRSLYRSRADDSYWRMDMPNKGDTRYLVRLDSPDGWDSFDATSLEKGLLLSTRGGVSDATCRWAGCTAFSLIDSAFCVDHTFGMGQRA